MDALIGLFRCVMYSGLGAAGRSANHTSGIEQEERKTLSLCSRPNTYQTSADKAGGCNVKQHL